MAPRRRLRKVATTVPWAVALVLLGGALFNFSALSRPAQHARHLTAEQLLFQEGRQIFRFDTFGDQAFWSGALQLQKAIEGAKHGGVGPGLSPKAALAVGLKVDTAALPASLVRALKHGKVNLTDPATTLALIKLNAVVGVRGSFNRAGTEMTSVGITCAVCHSTVDNSFASGIGRRLDGWPNRDLNVGAVISLAPNLQPVANVLQTNVPTVKKVLASWGRGKFDAELFMDGKAFRPGGGDAATLIPPAYGLAGVNLHTYTGWGSIPYWNSFVANLEMHGQGDFTDARLDNASQFPVAARNHFGHVRHRVDLVTGALPALQFYQLALLPPKPPEGSFNATAARRGRAVFDGQGKCASCHTPPTFTEGGWNLHTPASICTDSFQADRSPTHMYRTTPLRGLWARQKGGFYHDGRYRTLLDVVRHYNSCMNLRLTFAQESNLVQYLKSL